MRVSKRWSKFTIEIYEMAKLRTQIIVNDVETEALDMLTMKWIIPAFMAAALSMASVAAVPSAQAQSRSTPVVSVNPTDMARDLDTTRDDLRLINRCIDDGGGKQECLCVTQILKYEMTVADYRRDARLYAVPASVRTRGRQADYSLGSDTASTVVTRDITSMVSAPDFEYRCNDARRYFERLR